MIAHIVLLKPHASLSPVDRNTILRRVTTAVTTCPTVRACRIGRRILHGLPGYEQGAAEDYHYALIVEFDDVEGLRAYLQHPEHASLGELFTSATAGALAYDYEMLPIAEAQALL